MAFHPIETCGSAVPSQQRHRQRQHEGAAACWQCLQRDLTWRRRARWSVSVVPEVNTTPYEDVEQENVPTHIQHKYISCQSSDIAKRAGY